MAGDSPPAGAGGGGNLPRPDVRMRGFRDRAEVAELQRTLDARLGPLPAEAVELQRAAGRVLAADVRADVAVPAFDRAAMDGYALRGSETFGAGGAEMTLWKVPGYVGGLPEQPVSREVVATMGPAGENGTITLTACVGYSLAGCAAAFCTKPKPANASAAENSSRHAPLFMHSSLDFSPMLHCPAPLVSYQRRSSARRCSRSAGLSIASGLKCPDRRA